MQQELEFELTQALLRLADVIVSQTNGAMYMPGFRQALESDGGLTTARRILSLPIASCVLELRDRGLPHLTVEGFIALNPRYHPLLTKAELNTCLVRYEVAKGRVK